MSNTSAIEQPRYRVPALEKGFDILELLAGESEGLTQTQVAQRLSRSSDELFRIFVCLESRGYVQRIRPGDTYHLTSRLFALAHKHPPTKRLIDMALPKMRELSATNSQSCHLSIPTPEGMLVVAQTDAPENIGFAVRQGTVLDLETSSSGQLFVAFSTEEAVTGATHKRMLKNSFLKKASVEVRGVTDLCAPILDHRGYPLAILAVPFVKFLKHTVSMDDVLKEVCKTAQQLSETQGNDPQQQEN